MDKDIAQTKLLDFNLKNITGLSESKAASRLKREGYNELPSSKHRSILAIAYEVVQEPIFLLLVVCGAIYLFLGEVQDALILLGFVFFIMGITLYQEQKTEHALEALQDLSSPRASVIRGGQQKRIAGREVVRGDIVILAEGDRVPADGFILSCTNLTVDESLLTGESVPVRKVAEDGALEMARPGGDDLPFVYSGTLVVTGQGIAQIQTIGIHTEIGKIGKALQTVEPEQTLLQKETGQLVGKLAIIAISICVIVALLYGITRGDWLNGFLAAIALAMAILPNEFPVVVTIFLALGAWRISQKRVLARRMPAVETLGSATVLCVDKTGTLTLNQMSISQMFAQGEVYDLNLHSSEPLPETFHQLVEFSILASQRDPFDPMEKACLELGDRYLAHTEHLHDDWRLIREYPLSPQLLAMSHVWQSPDGSNYTIAAKGAPEAIAGMSLIPVLFKLPLVLLPIHIAFLHLIIDPACSVVFEAEPEEANVMNRPPRNPKEPLFSQQMLSVALLQGVGILLVLLVVFVTALYRGQGELDARALTFTTLIIANLSLILTNRSWSRTIGATLRSPNVALWWVLWGALIFLGVVLYLPFLRHLFRFSVLHPIDLAICLGAGIVSILWFERLKILNRQKRRVCA